MQEALPHVVSQATASRQTGQGVFMGVHPLFTATAQGCGGAEVPLYDQWVCTQTSEGWRKG